MRGLDSSLATSGWRNFPCVYGRLRSPLRPSPSDVEVLSHAIEADDKSLLLLGVTPELSVLGAELTAVDNSPRMLEQVWPGDGPRRRAVLGDWTDLPFASGSFDAVIGDGSLNSAPDAINEVLAEVRRVLAPGATAAFRLFCSPEEPESLTFIREDVGSGWPGNFHALKWRIAMSISASKDQAIVPVQEILSAFNDLFPDREALGADTGWAADDIATIDAYVGADHSLGFQPLSAMRAIAERHFPDVQVARASGYPLSERCPTIVCKR